MSFIVLFMIFSAVSLGGGAVAILVTQKWRMNRRIHNLLGSVEGPTDNAALTPYNQFTTLAVQWLKNMAKRPGQMILPADGWEKSSLKAKLVMAGFRNEEALSVFQGSRVILALFLPMAYLAIRTIANVLLQHTTVLILIFAFVGFYLPVLYLTLRIKKRQRLISKALPNTLDMMVICVEAGLGLDAAVQRVGEEISVACGEMSEELRLGNMELRAGKSRTEAFRNIGIRTGVDEMKTLAALLVQTDRFGTSIADALRTHADGVRTKRKQKLEEEAAKVATKLIFPLILFIFPAILVVMLGPGILRIIQVLLPMDGAGGR